MGISFRIFFVNDDDSLERIPLAKFERLRRGDPKERLSQYADKRLRYVLAAVEMEKRKPVGIHLIQYCYLHLDSEGQIDADEREKSMRLALDSLPPVKDRYTNGLVDAHHKFARRRYDHQYKWKPTPEIEAAIVKEIFGKGRK